MSIDPKPYLPGAEDKLRFQSVFFTFPNDAKGTSFLNIWEYGQTQFPELMGFLPRFKRVQTRERGRVTTSLANVYPVILGQIPD